MAMVRPDDVSADGPRFERIEELFQALESPLLSYGLRLTRDRAVAEDIVQEAFMKLHAQFNQVLEPRRWLYRTVHNLALNHQRSAGRTVPLVASVQEEGEGERLRDTADPQPLPD